MEPINMLIRLHQGYGLGDAVQMSAVLRHVVKARPNWRIDYQAEEGKQVVGNGIVHNTFAYGSSYPSNYYDGEIHIQLFDTFANWGDRPNTRVSSCLHERFGLPWDASCSRYHVQINPESIDAAHALLYGWTRRGGGHVSSYTRHLPVGGALRSTRCVAVHYEGDSSQAKKNLKHSQVSDICQAIGKLGYEPIILDWRNRSPLKCRRITTPRDWGGDAEMVCAVISQCAAFVGIDSGPSKCASATDTPALVVWTGHHPAPFHDPAPNTTHLVPVGYHGLEPVCNDARVIAWFETHHNVRQYECDPVNEIKRWLKEVLR